ncbi:hypothetical protein I3F58_04410 [Streptomyces sp. MUM 203J]|uniref:hypothetical protein n=1 Tax=Streptomyces sp. MUM 203J TaxID=2791990 RepID=UPI001F04A726|nr:hypothetical protein [Streptomyces sp. MUM 203J]MCH0538811.1 hypothetical protein [Streptomyces sp. MUM 203J]
MKSAPHLLPEDRADYERLLDEVLRTAQDRPELAAVGQRLNNEQLRTMAMDASAVISTAAAAEYDHFVRVRAEHRRPSGVAVMASVLGGSGDETARGAGIGVVITVLAPVLAGVAALVLLLVGYVLKLLDPPPQVADPLVTAGWFFAAVTAAGLLTAAIGLLVTALRNRSTEVHATQEPGGDLPDEISRAREAWRHALVERGILPFLRTVLAEPGTTPVAPAPPSALGRSPGTGFTSPDLTAPDPRPE